MHSCTILYSFLFWISASLLPMKDTVYGFGAIQIVESRRGGVLKDGRKVSHHSSIDSMISILMFWAAVT